MVGAKIGASDTGRGSVGTEHLKPPIGCATSSATRAWMASAAAMSVGRCSTGIRGPGVRRLRAARRYCAAAS